MTCELFCFCLGLEILLLSKATSQDYSIVKDLQGITVKCLDITGCLRDWNKSTTKDNLKHWGYLNMD
jgi:hypothetical protein